MQQIPKSQPRSATIAAQPRRQSRRSPVVATVQWWPRRAIQWFLMVLLVGLALLVLQSLLLTLRQPTVQMLPEQDAVNWLTTGFYAPEQDSRGVYRWTEGTSQMRLPHMGRGRLQVLGLQLGPTFPDHPASTLTLHFPERAVASVVSVEISDEPRRYLLAVPPDALAAEELTVELQSATMVVPPDTRTIGLRVEQVTLEAIGTNLVWITPLHALVQVLLLAVVAGLLLRLEQRLWPAFGWLVLTAAGLLLVTLLQPLLLLPYASRFLVAGVVLLFLTVGVLPLVERYLIWSAPADLLRLFWGIALLACCLRLAGSLYPLFQGFDLGLNVGRFIRTAGGELVVTSRSIEFRNGVTVYPPGGYLLLLPGKLVHLPTALLIQGGLAIIDGFGALTTALLAYVLGANRRAAILSALVFAIVPIHLTALWFGLTAQIIGQALTAPLAIALLVALRTSTLRAWLVAGVLLTAALLTHIGVAIVAVAWLGFAWLLLGLQRGDEPIAWSVWWRFTWVLVISGIISLLGTYGDVVLLKLEETFFVADKIQTSGYVPAYNLIVSAFWLSFNELGLLLAVFGLGLIWLQRERLPVGGAALILGALGVLAIFTLIEVLSGLQVRHLYFITPLVCLFVGLVLAGLMQRGWSGRWLGITILLLVLFESSMMWYRGAWQDVMMSMVPLLR